MRFLPFCMADAGSGKSRRIKCREDGVCNTE